MSCNANVESDDNAHKRRDRNVGVWKLHRFELIEEQRVARNLSHEITGNDQEVVTEKWQAPLEVAWTKMK